MVQKVQLPGRWMFMAQAKKQLFLTFPACFYIPIIFSNLNSNCSNSLDLRNLQEQVKKAFCYQKLFWPFTVWINCPSDLKSFSRSLEQFFLTVGQNNFGNKIPFQTWLGLLYQSFSQPNIVSSFSIVFRTIRIVKKVRKIHGQFF